MDQLNSKISDTLSMNDDLQKNNHIGFNQFFEEYIKKLDITRDELFTTVKKDNYKKYTEILKSAQEAYKEEFPEDYEKEYLYQKEKLDQKREEYKKNMETYGEMRKEEQIQMIMRQTDYTYETAKEKLVHFKYNTIKVIQEYMGIENKDTMPNTSQHTRTHTSINQGIYSNIRDFLGYKKL